MNRKMTPGGLQTRRKPIEPLTPQEGETLWDDVARYNRRANEIRYDQVLCYLALRLKGPDVFTPEIQEETGCSSLEEFLKKVHFPEGIARERLIELVELVDRETFVQLGESTLTMLVDAIVQARRLAGHPGTDMQALRRDCEPIFAAYAAEHSVYDEKTFWECIRKYLRDKYPQAGRGDQT